MSNVGPTTPSSIRTEPVSTTALPTGVEESKGTATPQQFEPDDDNGILTVSDNTYNHIRASYLSYYYFFLSTTFFFLFYYFLKLTNGSV